MSRPGRRADEITDFALGTDRLVRSGGQTIDTFVEVNTDGVGGVDSTLVTFSGSSSVLLTSVTGVLLESDLVF